MEELEHNPGRFLEKYGQSQVDNAVKIDLNKPMKEILATISKYPVKTRFSLTGPIIVGRDIAHAKIKERLDRGEPMPQYMKDHIIYYAGPAKTPKGMASGIDIYFLITTRFFRSHHCWSYGSLPRSFHECWWFHDLSRQG